MIAKLEGHTGLERKNMSAPEIIEPTRGISGEEVSRTPDSKYVLGGSLDKRVFYLGSSEPSSSLRVGSQIATYSTSPSCSFGKSSGTPRDVSSLILICHVVHCRQ